MLYQLHRNKKDQTKSTRTGALSVRPDKPYHKIKERTQLESNDKIENNMCCTSSITTKRNRSTETTEATRTTASSGRPETTRARCSGQSCRADSAWWGVLTVLRGPPRWAWQSGRQTTQWEPVQEEGGVKLAVCVNKYFNSQLQKNFLCVRTGKDDRFQRWLMQPLR